jgi:endonuclease/exonuclease/phosphatase family metal-dependent hydrolase
LLRVDRIYYRNLILEDARLLRGGIWSRLSDHAALTANFRLVE